MTSFEYLCCISNRIDCTQCLFLVEGGDFGNTYHGNMGIASYSSIGTRKVSAVRIHDENCFAS